MKVTSMHTRFLAASALILSPILSPLNAMAQTATPTSTTADTTANSAVSPSVTTQNNTATDITKLPAGTYTLDPTHASLTWKVNHLGLSHYTARFTKFDATLMLDPQNPVSATVSATIDPLSVQTDYPKPTEKDFNKELAEGAQWLNGTKFPTMTFSSTQVVLTGEKTAQITGDLTMLGVTKPITLNATFNGGYAQKPFGAEGVAAVGFSATGTLKRSDWGLASYIPMVGDEVQFTLETEFASAPQVAKPN